MDAEQEKHLVAAAKAGDKQAISTLYQAHVQAIYRYVVYRVHDPLVAEDITSNVFVRALETLPQYEQRGLPFLGWLYRIASGKVIDYYRRANRQRTVSLDEAMTVQDTNSPEQIASENMQKQQLMEHLKQLTADQQQAILLRFIEGHSLRKCAELMGKSEGAIKSLQFRALQTLAQLMQSKKAEVVDNEPE